MTNNLSFETAYALLRNIVRYTAADFDALGINQQDFELISGETPWRRDNLARVMRTMNALIFGTCEIMGIGKITIPAEYVATVVTAVVSPSNAMICCIWLSQERQTGVGVLELSARAGQTAQMDPASADMLFALVCQLMASTAATEARVNMRVRLGLAEERAIAEENGLETYNRKPTQAGQKKN